MQHCFCCMHPCFWPNYSVALNNKTLPPYDVTCIIHVILFLLNEYACSFKKFGQASKVFSYLLYCSYILETKHITWIFCCCINCVLSPNKVNYTNRFNVRYTKKCNLTYKLIFLIFVFFGIGWTFKKSFFRPQKIRNILRLNTWV